MIIVRAPYRISLLGGASDYDVYLDKYKVGLTINLTINKYSYIALQKLDKFPSRVIYSKIENVDFNGDIEHRGIWAAFNRENLFLQPLELFHASDLGGGLGLGSSSAFMVALIQTLSKLKNENLIKMELIKRAVEAEQSYSTVGWQDATASTLGGLRTTGYTKPKDEVVISSLQYNFYDARYKLAEYGLLFNTSQLRNSSDNVETYIDKINKNGSVKKIYDLAEEGVDLLEKDNFDVEKFGHLMRKSWHLKKHISDRISNSHINYLIEGVLAPLTYGSRLMGGGGGGCIFTLADPKNHNLIIEVMEQAGCKHIPYEMDIEGVKQLQ